ncbi:hypothetical protein RCG43_08965, partial [Staphylococcus aureus]
QHLHRRLAGAIGGVERRAAQAPDAGEIDDRGPAGPRPAPGLQQVEQALRADDHRIDVDRVDPVPFGQRSILDPPDDRDRRQIDQRIVYSVLNVYLTFKYFLVKVILLMRALDNLFFLKKAIVRQCIKKN